MNFKEIRTRLAPSPTGPLHIGTARTALFNWLFAKQNKGKFILRIEDTDKERSKKEYEDQIVEGLKWLGLNWDEGPYRQSERTEIYKQYLKKLLDEEKAYYCYCSKEELEADKQKMIANGLPPKYSGRCRNLKQPPAGKVPQLIRFKMPDRLVEFNDLIRGKVSFDASLFGDIAIAKDLETPLYNFAVVIDDFEMRISHIIRGEDHLSNTPK
ncbi:glutamate--tRNA ligase, partial [Patescibacteria group bacterium]|nr:glutamate--tRNA ligase [Patescibacteria group bacterium]